MKYFAVLGKNRIISTKELNNFVSDLKQVNDFIVTFDIENTDRLNTLGGIIKWGRIVNESDLKQELEDIKIIGINNEDLGKQFKRDGLVRRFKLVKLGHTDLEIKNKGKELIKIDNNHYGIVEGFQNIKLYEDIDFGKPGRSMQMGMMPAKLTHIMINLGLNKDSDNITVYDPFVGSGTTGFLANYMGYDFIGSDIETKYVDQNINRWKNNKFNNANKTFKISQHDINDKLIAIPTDTVVVTEGRLGPIIKKNSTEHDIQYAQSQVLKLYNSFLSNFLISESIKTLVFTIPYYIGHDNILENQLTKLTTELNRKIEIIPEVYSRPDQNVGRKIIIIQ